MVTIATHPHIIINHTSLDVPVASDDVEEEMELEETHVSRKRQKPQSSSVPKKKLTSVTTPTKRVVTTPTKRVVATPTKRVVATPTKQVCKYGVKCYQINKDHRDEFSHPWVSIL